MKTTTTRLEQIADVYSIDDRLTAFTTTRRGGCSSGNYASMNVNGFCGDNPADVACNRKILSDLLQISIDRLIMPHQVHGTVVCRVDEAILQLSPEERAGFLEGADAVMTDTEEVCVGVSTADCTPIILYDTQHVAVCVAHAGWRGTLQRIVVKALDAMHNAYGTESAYVRAVIGPCISTDNFEVGDEVYDAFCSAGFPMDIVSVRMAKWHIDLKECNRWLLAQCGVSTDNELVSPACTYAMPERYFSARRLGTASGRLFTGAIIRQRVNEM